MEQPQLPKAPKAIILAFIANYYGPFIHTITTYVQEPENKELIEHIRDPEELFTQFGDQVNGITTINQLKDFERIFFRTICTINSKYIIARWNELIENMSKFVISYRQEECRFRQYSFNIPRCLLLCKLLETMMSMHVSEDVKNELNQLYSKFKFTAPEFDEKMKEHIHTLDVLIKTKCADTELAVLYDGFCQQLVLLLSEYNKGF